MELKLSQKDVAAKINEKPSVLQDYESSKAIPNPQILGKLERALGVKLRGTFSSSEFPCPRSDVPCRSRHWEETGGEEIVDMISRLHPPTWFLIFPIVECF
jgi:transcriptional regulator with XRE-family HTH domain